MDMVNGFKCPLDSGTTAQKGLNHQMISWVSPIKTGKVTKSIGMWGDSNIKIKIKNKK